MKFMIRYFATLVSVFWISAFFISFTPNEARAFPDTVRHGYIHCTACHVSLNGGDLLTPYGRSLSRELISQQTLGGKPAAEGDEQLLGGAIRPPSWLTAGADIRLLQTFVESSKASKARFMIMQVDLDLMAQIGEKVRAYFSVGRVEPRVEQPKARDFVGFPRYWLDFLVSPPDAENRLAVRAGKFMPAYGIYFAEHTLATRKFLDFQPGQERIGGDIAWNNDQYSAILTAIGGRASGNEIKDEKGGIVQLATAAGENSKVGVNYYQTERDNNGVKFTRRIYGAFAYIGFAQDWYGLLEVDRPQNADGKWGLVETFKLGYEIHQGLRLIGIQEFANLDSENTDPKFEAYSAGVEWFPRPHWDLYGLYRKERDSATLSEFQDVFWFVGHYYF